MIGLLLVRSPSGAVLCARRYNQCDSRADFAELMTDKQGSLEWKCNFCDSPGLHNGSVYSTVEILLFLKYCIKNDTFREIVESHQTFYGVTNIHPDGITYYNYNV